MVPSTGAWAAYGGLRGQAAGDVTKRDENPPTVTSAEVDPSAVTEIGGTPNRKMSLNANSPAEGQATQQRQLTHGQVQLPDALDTAGKQVSEGLNQTRKNLKGAAEQTRKNVESAGGGNKKSSNRLTKADKSSDGSDSSSPNSE